MTKPTSCDDRITQHLFEVAEPVELAPSPSPTSSDELLRRALARKPSLASQLPSGCSTAASKLLYLMTHRVLAKQVSALPPLAVKWTKVSMNRMLKEQFNTIMDGSIAYEMLSMVSKDRGEALSAFIEKRKPSYKGL